MKHTKVAFTY